MSKYALLRCLRNREITKHLHLPSIQIITLAMLSSFITGYVFRRLLSNALILCELFNLQSALFYISISFLVTQMGSLK